MKSQPGRSVWRPCVLPSFARVSSRCSRSTHYQKPLYEVDSSDWVLVLLNTTLPNVVPYKVSLLMATEPADGSGPPTKTMRPCNTTKNYRTRWRFYKGISLATPDNTSAIPAPRGFRLSSPTDLRLYVKQARHWILESIGALVRCPLVNSSTTSNPSLKSWTTGQDVKKCVAVTNVKYRYFLL